MMPVEVRLPTILRPHVGGVATLTAMVFNYIVNNAMTYRDVRLRGARFWKGLALFCAICSIGGMAILCDSSGVKRCARRAVQAVGFGVKAV